MVEYEINLENLVKMKRVFEEADEDGSGELDPDEFYEKLGPFLGNNLSRTQVAQLFMRIDADCGGTIDWEEFTNYFFLQRAATNTNDGGADWRLHPQDTWRKEWRGMCHKEAVDVVLSCGSLDQYVTGGRAGQLRVWGGPDLAPLQTITNSDGWITDCAFLEGHAAKKLVVAAQDRTITFYDAVRAGFQYSGRLSCPGSLGPPMCLAGLQRERDAGGLAMPRLVWGDTEGAVMLLKCPPPLLPTPRQLVAKKDYDVLHSGHSDWVTHVEHIPDVGLLSSSLDSTLCLLDLDRAKLAATVALHRKGVRTFGYSPAFSLVASAGVERSVLLWQPKGNVTRAVGELPGHSAGVRQLVVADEQSQVITLSDDHVVRVWDLRNHKCVQALGAADWLRAEDSKPTAMWYDCRRRQLICTTHRPAGWSHRPLEMERLHDSRLVGALYNSTFSVVVSGDEGGTICLWNLQNGKREGGFSLHARPASTVSSAAAAGAAAAGALAAGSHAQQKLTALAFDANQRRLLTATDCGEVKMWNFNSGAVLRQFLHKEGCKEITAVAFVRQQEAAGDAPGAGVDDTAEGQAEADAEDALQEQRLEGSTAAAAAASAGEGQAVAETATSGSEGCSDLSEHALLVLQQHRSQQAQQRSSQQHASAAACDAALQQEGSQSSSSSSSSQGGPASLVLATGWSRSLCMWQEGEEPRCSGYERLTGHTADILSMALLGADIAATGDFEGEVRVWHLPSATCLASFNCGGPQFERAIRQMCWLPLAAGSAEPAVLVTAGEDGGLQFWRVRLPAEAASVDGGTPAQQAGCDGNCRFQNFQQAFCRLVARIAAAHRPRDCITALCVGSEGQLLWTGDSSGHVAAWDVSALTRSEPHQADGCSISELPRRLVHWRAAHSVVVSMEAPASGQAAGLLLVAAQDAAISVWTQQAALVGVFGKHSWELEDTATWQDPEAKAVPPPLAADAGGTGLTPRKIIAHTPRRTSWLHTGSEVQDRAHQGSLSAQQSSNLDGGGSSVGSPRSARSSKAAAELADVLASITRSQPPQKEASGSPKLPGVARSSTGSSGFYSTAPSPNSAAGLGADSSLFAVPEEQAQHDSPVPAAVLRCQSPSPGAGTGGADSHKPLQYSSAGAQLAALMAGAAAAKAESWSIPVYVQPHSQLALQQMREVAPLPAECGKAGSPGHGSRSASRSASSSPTRSRRGSAAAPTITSIMARATTAFGRRATQPHQDGNSK